MIAKMLVLIDIREIYRGCSLSEIHRYLPTPLIWTLAAGSFFGLIMTLIGPGNLSIHTIDLVMATL
jgi:hypothetical protein